LFLCSAAKKILAWRADSRGTFIKGTGSFVSGGATDSGDGGMEWAAVTCFVWIVRARARTPSSGRTSAERQSERRNLRRVESKRSGAFPEGLFWKSRSFPSVEQATLVYDKLVCRPI